jgi:hypothetical protein
MARSDYHKQFQMFKVRVTKRPSGKARFHFAAGDVVDAYTYPKGDILAGSTFLLAADGESWNVKATCWERVA